MGAVLKQGADVVGGAMNQVMAVALTMKWPRRPAEFLMYALWREQPVWAEVRCQCPRPEVWDR